MVTAVLPERPGMVLPVGAFALLASTAGGVMGVLVADVQTSGSLFGVAAILTAITGLVTGIGALLIGLRKRRDDQDLIMRLLDERDKQEKKDK
jgi:ethanolamine ammonia-lyase large subunit